MDIFRLELHCPDIKTQVDADQVKQALASSPGFSKAVVNIATHQVIVTTANQDAGRDIVRRLAHAGFPPDETERVTYAEHERSPRDNSQILM